MPRKAPKEVIEHRITLGDYERKILNEAQNAYAFQKYASPLNSPVLSVALLGGGAYLGLAYAFDWWPFDKQGTWTWESLNPVAEKLNRYNNGEAVLVTNELYELAVSKHTEKVGKYTARLAEIEGKSGIFFMMERKQLELYLQTQDAILQTIHDRYAAKLEAATIADQQWAEKQAED
jgi:hypothetical protein